MVKHFIANQQCKLLEVMALQLVWKAWRVILLNIKKEGEK